MSFDPPTPAEAEARMREIVRNAGLPPPDEVEHHSDEIVLFWHEEKLVVSVDLST